VFLWAVSAEYPTQQYSSHGRRERISCTKERYTHRDTGEGKLFHGKMDDSWVILWIEVLVNSKIGNK
jgi:hypothetical protein